MYRIPVSELFSGSHHNFSKKASGERRADSNHLGQGKILCFDSLSAVRRERVKQGAIPTHLGTKW